MQQPKYKSSKAKFSGLYFKFQYPTTFYSHICSVQILCSSLPVVQQARCEQQNKEITLLWPLNAEHHDSAPNKRNMYLNQNQHSIKYYWLLFSCSSMCNKMMWIELKYANVCVCFDISSLIIIAFEPSRHLIVDSAITLHITQIINLIGLNKYSSSTWVQNKNCRQD